MPPEFVHMKYFYGALLLLPFFAKFMNYIIEVSSKDNDEEIKENEK